MKGVQAYAFQRVQMDAAVVGLRDAAARTAEQANRLKATLHDFVTRAQKSLPRVLVVEDCEDDRLLECRALRGHAHVTCVATPEEAAHLVETESWDAVIVDMLLTPIVSGAHVIALVRQSAINGMTPVLALSGEFQGDERVVEAARRAHATAVAHKPLRAEDLLAILR